MIVETGSDVLGVPGSAALPISFYLSAEYSGSQFAQIDWDGGIGIPSGSAYVQQGNSFIVQDLMNNGTISPSLPYVSFNWDPVARAGTCELGGFDPTKYIASEGIYMPWVPYTQFKGGEYIWTRHCRATRWVSRRSAAICCSRSIRAHRSSKAMTT